MKNPEKEQFRPHERAHADSLVQRLVDNTRQSIETRALHLAAPKCDISKA